MEVHEAGGGINYTVEHTKKASEEELYTLLADRLRRMIKSGKLKLNMKNLCAKAIKLQNLLQFRAYKANTRVNNKKDETKDLFFRRQMVLLILHLQ